jgi:hypothetical protein
LDATIEATGEATGVKAGSTTGETKHALTGDNTVISIDGDATGAATSKSNGVSTGASTIIDCTTLTRDVFGAFWCFLKRFW